SFLSNIKKLKYVLQQCVSCIAPFGMLRHHTQTVVANARKSITMKNIITILLVALTLNSFGQWETLNSESTEWLRGIAFTDKQTGIVVGQNGTILRTTDAGDAWTKIASGTTKSIHSVYMVDSDYGYATGIDGLILKTIDGGLNWSDVSYGNRNLHQAHFLTRQLGYVAGQLGALYKTLDGGNSWDTLSIPHNGLVYLFFHNADTGYVSGLGRNDAIIKTTDGGANWTNLHSTVLAEYSSILFTNLDTGFVCTSTPKPTQILRTEDAGQTWNIVHSGVKDGLYAIRFPSTKIGYSCGGYSGSSIMLKTSDAGSTWASQNTGNANPLFDCFFLNDTLGYAVGMNGTIIKTTSDIVGIRSENSLSSVNIYPNPTSDYLNISGINSTNLEVTILDFNGKILLEESLESDRSISVENLSKGTYLISIESDFGQTLKKIVIH
ncbi:MAG: T9SS type A sorting domain-containing protein, partial [Flavobacteriales bacterium]